MKASVKLPLINRLTIPLMNIVGKIILFGNDFLNKFGGTIHYNDNILHLVDDKIAFKDPDDFFDTNMVNEFMPK